MSDKPSYAVPSIAEINAIEPSGLTVASTFAGCGGSSLGYRMAGFRVLYANEFVAAARDTYEANKREWTHVDGRDVRDVTPESLCERAGVEIGQLDVLDGSPPCASFSTAGKRAAKWGTSSSYSDTEQRSDDLFFEFARIVEGVQPRVFVAENVSGLVKGVAKGYFKAIHRALAAAGYDVEARLISAEWLGVPQARQRVIFVGVRSDLGWSPAFPDPLPYRYSIRDALGGLDGGPAMIGRGRRTLDPDAPAPTVQTHGNFDPETGYGIVQVTRRTGPGFVREGHDLDEPIGTIQASDPLHTRWEIDGSGPLVDPETGESIALGKAIGAEWDRTSVGASSDRYFQLVRSDADRPVGTVTASGGNIGLASVVHGTERRKFTLGELRRLCSFPDDFVLTGTYAQRWERLGRAVPPLMMRAIAETIRDRVLS